jgi:hypothetical protein
VTRRRDAVEQPFERRRAAPPEALADRRDVEALLELGLADEPLELVGIELVRQVDDGPGDRRDRDADVHRSLLWRRPSYVHRDAGSAALGRGRHLGSSGGPPP